MVSNFGNEGTLVERLEAAESAIEIVGILGDISAVKQLSAHGKQPVVRKIIMLLANPDPALDAQSRLRCLAFLAALSTLKSVRLIVDEFAPRALAEPVSEVASTLSNQEKHSIALWLSNKKMAWIGDFAARSAVAESKDEQLCQAYLGLLSSRNSSVSQVIQRLNQELRAPVSSQFSPLPAGKRNLCMALARMLAKASLIAGKDLPDVFCGFAMEQILRDGQAYQANEKSAIAISVSELLFALTKRFPTLLHSEVPFQIISILQGEWVLPADRKWKLFKQQLFAEVEGLITVLAVSGVCAIEQVRKAKMLEGTVGATENILRGILEQNDISSEEVATWLTNGGAVEGTRKERLQESVSETETIAQVLLRANELAAAGSIDDRKAELDIRETLLTEINLLAARKGLQLDSERNSIVSYDSARQRATGAVPAGGRVRVLSPGVVRKGEKRLFQVIQAIVEPCEG